MANKQITVRIPEELVAFVDGEVEAQTAESRAAVVSRALLREQRRVAAEADATIYARGPAEPDEESLLAWMARRAYPDLG